MNKGLSCWYVTKKWTNLSKGLRNESRNIWNIRSAAAILECSFSTTNGPALPNYPTFGETHPFTTVEGPSILSIVGDLMHTSRNTYVIRRYTSIFAFAYSIFIMEHSLHDFSHTLSIKVINVNATFQTLTITLPIHVWSSISYYFPSIAIN